MRTNIVLDNEVLAEAMKYSLSKSKRAVVQEALETYVAAKRAEAQQASYREKLERMRRKLSGIRPTESAHDIVRRDRERAS